MSAPRTGESVRAHDSGAALGSPIAHALVAASLVLMLLHLVLYVHYAIGLMRFPFDYDQGEGFELVDTMMFSRGEWPYRHNESYPFYASNYPPLFHVMLVPFAWLFGPAYWYGRLAGLLATLITATIIGWIVWREERHRPVAVVAGLAYLASNYVYHVGPLFRQHITMVMFETLSVAILAHVASRPAGGPRRRVIALGLLALLAAGFTKQLAVATAVAVFAWLFVRNPRRSLAWGLVFAGVVGGLFAWINWATDGAWWTNIVAANVNEYYPAQFVGLLKQYLRLHWALLVPAVLYVLYELYFGRLSLYSVWWVFASANTVLSGKWGAGDSYFATAIAASAVLAGLFIARTVRGGWTFADNYLTRLAAPALAQLRGLPAGRAVRALTPGLLVIYGLSVVKLPTDGGLFGPLAAALGLESSYGERYAFYDAAGWTPGYATIGHVPTQADIDNGWRVVERVRASERPVMSEEAAFSLHADRDVVTNPTQLKNLYENGLFDPTGLVAAIDDQAFGLIIFRAQFYPPPVLDAVYQAYYPVESIPMNGFDYEIWHPGPDETARRAFADALEPAAEPATIPVGLSVDAARIWAAHAMTYRGWIEMPAVADVAPECATAEFTSNERAVAIGICHAGQEAVLHVGTRTP